MGGSVECALGRERGKDDPTSELNHPDNPNTVSADDKQWVWRTGNRQEFSNSSYALTLRLQHSTAGEETPGGKKETSKTQRKNRGRKKRGGRSHTATRSMAPMGNKRLGTREKVPSVCA